MGEPENLSPRETLFLFVGGTIAWPDGSQMNSWQICDDLLTGEVLLQALATTRVWWDVVSSLVAPLLDGPRADYALISGPRTVRASAESKRRIHLNSVLPGGLGSISVLRSDEKLGLPPDHERAAVLRGWSDSYEDSLGIRFDGGSPRWRFVDPTYYSHLIARHFGAHIVVDVSGEFAESCFKRLPYGTKSVDHLNHPEPLPPVIILPDTDLLRKRVESLFQAAPTHTAAIPIESDFDARRDVRRKGIGLAAVANACSVTGVLRNGEWVDPRDFEAARTLLLERFDLKLGLLDLAFNPTLRATVLDAIRGTPRGRTEGTTIPPVAIERAAAREEERSAARKKARSRQTKVLSILYRDLANEGWKRRKDSLALPLTSSFSDGRGRDPLAGLRLEITKSCVRVVAWHRLYNQLDLGTFVSKHRADFEDLCDLSIETRQRGIVYLWSAEVGWGNESADWTSVALTIARSTGRWRSLLSEFVADVVSEFQRRRSAHRA